MRGDRPPGWGEDACVVCPARCGLGPGEFDVVDGPGADFKLAEALRRVLSYELAHRD